MLCSDLDRYLEAFVDGRLGRSRTIILRRHLSGCARCRTKVDRLRQFEREIAGQLRTVPDGPSVWHGLEQDLARNASGAATALLSSPRILGAGAGPARPPRTRGAGIGAKRLARRTRRRISQLLGVVALTLAVGAVWELARDWLDPIFSQVMQLDGGAPPVHAASPAAEHLAN